MKEVGTVGFDALKMNSLAENLQGQSSKSFKFELLPIRPNIQNRGSCRLPWLKLDKRQW